MSRQGSMANEEVLAFLLLLLLPPSRMNDHEPPSKPPTLAALFGWLTSMLLVAVVGSLGVRAPLVEDELGREREEDDVRRKRRGRLLLFGLELEAPPKRRSAGEPGRGGLREGMGGRLDVMFE